jgi:chromate transport protein ChrA
MNACPEASRDERPSAAPPRSRRELFTGFLSIGARSFGGVLPPAYDIMVEKRHWLTPTDFTETIAPSARPGRASSWPRR